MVKCITIYTLCYSLVNTHRSRVVSSIFGLKHLIGLSTVFEVL